MTAYIHNIATVVPEQSYDQSFLRDRMKEYISDEKMTRRIIHRIYSNSGIDKRHTVIHDFKANGDPRFFFQKDGSMKNPSTGQRNKIYADKAKDLFIESARRTIDQNSSVGYDDISHIITVSCTGFFAPEPGFEIIQQLGLSPSTQRYHIGFMGCFAAFPAMKMAKAFCDSQPDAKVLVICLELCSIHLQASEGTDQLISASVFADGAAGMIISSDQSAGNNYELECFSTSIAKKSKEDMAWTIGDTGFDMVLSTYVPDIIESNIEEAVQPLFDDYSYSTDEINYWALHPGGRSILDKIQNTFSLNDNQLYSSRKVLADYGNMSSATILFVLADLLEHPLQKMNETVLAMAFGPGLTIESGLLNKTRRH